ncbi:DUF4124 domain-containing protein [Legionella dresdenensis]|uniref:DUF4124 domain-containing protein n=1 Tax=Legionella dresdenensis TaxID=450200 RepID=A0ABV8CCD9_9GAMM
MHAASSALLLKRAVILFTVPLFLCQPVFGQIYQWTDSGGVVHFSDRPHPGAKEIELPQAQSNAPAAAPAPTDQPAEESAGKENDRGYNSLMISQPANESTIRNNQGYVPVVIAIEPELKPNDKLQLLYDGETIGAPQSTPVFQLNDVKRGSHTIAVQVIDGQGEVIQTSESITIFMHRPRVGMVPGTRPR